MRPRLSVTRNTTPDPAVRLHGHRDLRKLEGIPACIFQFGQGGITLPFGDGLPGHTHFFSQLFLGKAQLAALGGNGLADGHGGVPLCCFAALSIAQSRPICPPAVRCDLSISGCIRISTRFPPGRPSPRAPAEANSPVGFGRENEPELRGPDGCRPSPAAGQSRKIS